MIDITMKYKATQIYLEPEQHRSLKDEARNEGVSMAEFLRQTVADRLKTSEKGTDLTPLSGTLTGPSKCDVGKNKREMLEEAMAKRHDIR